MAAAPDNEKVRQALQRLRGPSGVWVRGGVVLVLSVVALLALGLTRFDATAIGLLAVVVLLHELGHLGAMRLLGYSNLRVFLTPLFGGAAAGRSANAPGWQRAVVALAGPLPGLALGYVLLVAYFHVDVMPVATAGVLFVILNALNLLPLYPLDGGRFMNDVLFCRHRHVETAFKGVAALVLIGLGVLSRNWIIGALGGLMSAAAILSAKLGAIAHELRRQQADIETDDDIPPAFLDRIIEAVRKSLGSGDAAIIASAVNSVWERTNVRPPGAAATLGLLGLYLGSVASVAIVPILIIGLVMAGALPMPSSGTFVEYISALQAEKEARSTIEFAVLDGDTEALRRYLDGGGSVDWSNRNGDTLLMSAAFSGCLECVRMLADHGAEVNRTDNSGDTAVSSAVLGGHADVLKYLIESGAEVDRRTDDGDTPLIQAARWGNDACIELILAAGANPNRRAMNGRTALDFAEDRDEGDPERAAIMARLIAAGGRRRP